MAYSKTSPNLGLTLPDVNNPDDEPGGPIALLTAALVTVDGYLGNEQVITSAGAITITAGKVVLHTGAASAITLALPTAGLPAASGNDTQEPAIFSYDAYAYTVTTPSNGLNGAKHIATFGAAAGNSITLIAYNGFWFVKALNGVTLS